MATTLLKTPPAFGAPAAYLCVTSAGDSNLKSHNFTRVSFITNRLPVTRCRIYNTGYKRSSVKSPGRSVQKLLTFAAGGEAAEAQTEAEENVPVPESEPLSEFVKSNIIVLIAVQENADGAVDVDSSSENEVTVHEEHSSVVITSLNSYKEALANNNDSKIAEVESFLRTIEDEKVDLERKVARLSEELSYERDRVLRTIADFDNFRKRTERERLSLFSNAQGEIVENLLPILDNFERAKAQIKIETEGEEKVSNSYQSIYKQFVEVFRSLGVVPLETVGKPFDPMLHEAIIREDSTQYEDGVVIEEYRKGFQLGDRLLRPSMVKVSAGPGPAKPNDQEEDNGTKEEGAQEPQPLPTDDRPI
ncbi:hypothetical protein OROMI_028518 [Orobanche minor]